MTNWFRSSKSALKCRRMYARRWKHYAINWCDCIGVKRHNKRACYIRTEHPMWFERWSNSCLARMEPSVHSLSSHLYYLTNCVIALHKFHNTEHYANAGRTFSLQLRFRAKSNLDCFFFPCWAVNNIQLKDYAHVSYAATRCWTDWSLFWNHRSAYRSGQLKRVGGLCQWSWQRALYWRYSPPSFSRRTFCFFTTSCSLQTNPFR